MIGHEFDLVHTAYSGPEMPQALSQCGPENVKRIVHLVCAINLTFATGTYVIRHIPV